MNGRDAALAAALVVGVVLVGAYVLGFGSFAGDIVPNIVHSNPLDGTQAENNATNGSDGSTGGGGGSGGGAAGSGAAVADGGSAQQTARFTFEVRQIQSCGTTCRDVTVAARNTGDESARDVVVVTTIYAKDDQLWEGRETFAKVDGEETKVRTKRINLDYFDAAKIQQNDGYITVKTTVRWDGGRETFSERRKVA